MSNSSSKIDKEIVYKKFSIREFGGAFGDWGTLIPFVIGYVAIVGLNPAGVFFCLGLTNILLGIKYNLPLPVQPQKTIGSIALAEKWTPNLVISTGFGTGVIWLLLGISKKLSYIVQKIPVRAVKGIQLGLGLILGWAALLFLGENVLLGITSLIIIILLIKVEKVPSAIILTLMGIFIIFFSGSVLISDLQFSLPNFDFQIPTLENLLIGMIIAGFAQLMLTLTNVMFATVSLARELFPEKQKSFDANSLAVNMGIMNLINPFFGGMPQCHGSGGLAAQYAFGARTGGSMIFEGTMELFLGLFFSGALFLLFNEFPKAILGAMLLYTAFLLGKIAFKGIEIKSLPIILISALLCFFFNILIGFIFGLVAILIIEKFERDEEKSDQSTQDLEDDKNV